MRELWFESDGVLLFAVEDGQGPAIVMLHGGMASHQASLPLIMPLREWYRLIAPDLAVGTMFNLFVALCEEPTLRELFGVEYAD